MSQVDFVENSCGGGFNFDNYARNVALLKADAEQAAAAAQFGGSMHHAAAPGGGLSIKQMAKKTGTTICGMVYANGVVLGADTRSTNGDEVAEKNCEKIHYMAPNIYCCGAGTAADTEKTTELMSSQLELLRMETHSESRVVTAMTKLKRMLHRYQGHVSAALVLGGCDVNGPHLYQIYPHGSTGKLPYTSMGSGSLAAIAVLETSWKPNLSEDEAVTLVQRAILAGVFNDLGSGSNCDITIIRTDKTVDIHRGMVKPNPVEPLRAAIQRSNRMNMHPGITPVISTTFTPHPVDPAAGADTASEMEVEE